MLRTNDWFNLELLKRQLGQVRQRRIAGAEIIHGETDANLPKFLHLGNGVGDIIKHDALRQLKF